MKKTFFIVLTVFMAIPAVSFAKKTTYIYTNYRLNYVKTEEVGKKDLKKRGPFGHPYLMAPQEMGGVLSGILLNRSFVISKEVETQEVFDTNAVGFLAPFLAEGLKTAKPNEEIVFSYLDKNPKLVLRSDRITVGKMWVKDQYLHIEFAKLMAKLFGDYDKRGNFAQVVNRAKGLRVSLETKPGYELGSSSEELIINLKKVTQVASQEKAQVKEEKRATELVPNSQVMEKRLKELKKLRKKGLITEEEYQAKRSDILKDL